MATRLTRFELRLLGGATLLDATGQPLAGRAVHRHRIALLAYLALARESGASREKLIGVLWPERDTAAARHLLRAALHELRQALGAPALEAVGDVVHLDAGRVLVDVHQFEDARAAGDLEKAVALYRGPFLDGLFLDDAEEFESWVSGQRTRLEREYEAALEALAERATRQEQPVRAAEWWRTLAGRRPGDARVVVCAMDAIAALGDRPGALALADAHARVVGADYGTKPDAAVVALSARLRAEGTAMPITMDVAPPVPVPPVVPPAPSTPDDPRRTHPLTLLRPSSLTHRPGWRGRWLAVAGAVVALAATGAWSVWARAGDGTRGATPDVLAVAPFTLVAGAPPELREGLSELLTQSLGQVAELRVVPARLVAARTAELDPDDATEPARLARALRAGSVITGSVAQTPAGLVVTASLVDDGGATRARVEARGATTDLEGLVDQLSVGLLRELWGRRSGMPEPRLEAITTSSPAALRAYLRGEAFLRKALWDSAAGALATAVDLDSTFALAQLRLAEPYGWRYGMASEPARRALEAAQRFGHRLPHRERALLAFRLLHEDGDLRALDSAEALVRRYPGDPEMQYVRADARFHASTVMGAQFSAGTAAAFDTASRLDSGSARVWAHPVTLALRMGDSVRYDRAVAHLIGLTPGSHVQVAEHPDYALLRRVRWSAPEASYRALVDRLHTTPPHTWQMDDLLRAVERACLLADRPAPELVDSAYAAALATYPDAPFARGGVLGSRAWLALSLGRLAEARPLIDRIWESDPKEALRLALVPVVAGYAPPDWVAGDRARLARASAARDPRESYLRPFLRAQLALATGDAPAARALLRESEALAARHSRGVARGRRGVFQAAGGWARLVEGDTADGIAEMESGLALVGYEGDALNDAWLMRVVLLRTLARRSDRRADAVDRIRGHQLAGPVWPWWSHELAGALRPAGDESAAAREERRFAALWAGADPAARAAASLTPPPAPPPGR